VASARAAKVRSGLHLREREQAGERGLWLRSVHTVMHRCASDGFPSAERAAAEAQRSKVLRVASR
jgi:hypothetical protein